MPGTPDIQKPLNDAQLRCSALHSVAIESLHVTKNKAQLRRFFFASFHAPQLPPNHLLPHLRRPGFELSVYYSQSLGCLSATSNQFRTVHSRFADRAFFYDFFPRLSRHPPCLSLAAKIRANWAPAHSATQRISRAPLEASVRARAHRLSPLVEDCSARRRTNNNKGQREVVFSARALHPSHNNQEACSDKVQEQNRREACLVVWASCSNNHNRLLAVDCSEEVSVAAPSSSNHNSNNNPNNLGACSVRALGRSHRVVCSVVVWASNSSSNSQRLEVDFSEEVSAAALSNSSNSNRNSSRVACSGAHFLEVSSNSNSSRNSRAVCSGAPFLGASSSRHNSRNSPSLARLPWPSHSPTSRNNHFRRVCGLPAVQSLEVSLHDHEFSPKSHTDPLF